ncbi:acyl-CoA dehydrogenase family protein [Sphingobium aromaticiconvertens]|uniref:acyl-CoA dehydrogenase family protein n=1 Tax=Sphingobium aromaticiconvertens TaxID=365341 RepID=UPI0030187E40
MEEHGIELGELRDSIRQVLDEHHAVVGNDIPDEEGRPVDRELWTQMANLGWLALGIDESFGGLGLGAGHVAVLHEELGRSLASVPATTLIAAEAIGQGGSPDQQAEWLPLVATGELMATILLPSTLGNVPAIANDRLSGRYDHVPFADVAQLFLLPVAQADGTLALALLRAGSDGVSVRRRSAIDLTRSLGEVHVTDVALQAGDLIPLSDTLIATLRSHADVALACDAVGGAAAALERAIDYMGVREQFGRPIGSFQALKHRAANWKVLLEAATALARHSAEAVASGEVEAEALAASAKFYCCDVYAALAADVIQLHGGIGFTWEHVCHLFLKRAKLNQQMFGNSVEHKERVARLAFPSLAMQSGDGSQEGIATLNAPELNAV